MDKLSRENRELRQKIEEMQRIHKRVDDRKEKEYRLKYLSFINSIPSPVFIYDAVTYKFLHCNESATRHYGYSRQEILGLTPFDLHKPEEFEILREHMEKKSTGRATTFTHLTRDRRERTVEITTTDIYFDGNPAWMSIVYDITERIAMQEELAGHRHRLEEMVNERTLEVLVANKQLKQEIREREKAEGAILESEKKFRNIIEKSLDGVVLIDEKGTIIEWNQGQETIYGTKRAMVVGKKIWDVQYQHEPREKRINRNHKQIEKLWKDFFNGGANPFANDLNVSKIETPAGHRRDIQQLYFTIGTENGTMMACTTRDITEKLEIERQLMQSQKLEAIGTLAGGIAHDFNNILGTVIGYTDLAAIKSRDNAQVTRYLSNVSTACTRATELVKQILTFSRREEREKKTLRPDSIVKETLKLVRSSLPEHIDIISSIDSDAHIFADPTHLHQVVMNLITNASHAMKENGGKLGIKLTETVLEDDLYKGLKPGPHVRLTISDSGYGIEPELLDKIFDPFFTTKKEGEGTGMGLAVVHGIVESHNGHISVFSKKGEGTTFSILFPVVKDVILKEKTSREEPIAGGSEKILLVEDDRDLAEAEKELFQELGYHVTSLATGVEAFEIFQKLPGHFDLVITDYIMPRMTGLQLIEKIRALESDVPVILCTGYSEMIPPDKIKSLNIAEMIMKPIKLSEIARIIRRLVTGGAAKN